MRGTSAGLFLFAVVGWMVASGRVGSSAQTMAGTAAGAGARNSVIRAQRFVLEDAQGVERGSLEVQSGNVVLQAHGLNGASGVEIELCAAETPYVLVRSPAHKAAVQIVAEENAWIVLSKGERPGFPGVHIGISGGGPSLALNDSERTRAILGVIGGWPQLLLCDPESKVVWQTPVPPLDPQARAALQAQAEASAKKNAEEISRALEQRRGGPAR